MPVLEDQGGDAERRRGRDQVSEDADRRNQGRPEGDQQEQEAEPQDDADHQRRLCRQGRLEVMTFCRRAAEEGSRGKRGAQPVDGVSSGALVGTACVNTSPSAPTTGSLTAAMPESARRIAAVALASVRGAITCNIAGAPGPKASLICR